MPSRGSVRAGTAATHGRDLRPRRPGPVTDGQRRDHVRSLMVMESRPSPTLPPPSEPTATLAEDLPELYRTILDRIAQLELIGSRREAGRIRVAATRAYSAAWDESARRRLLGLLARAERGLVVSEQSRGWWLRRRTVSAR